MRNRLQAGLLMWLLCWGALGWCEPLRVTIAEAKRMMDASHSKHPECVIRATVTMGPGNNVNAPGNFEVQDSTGAAMVVRTQQVLPLQLWQRVEVQGTLDWNPVSPKVELVDESLGYVSINATRIVSLGMGGHLEGRLLARSDALNGLYPIELVRVRGRVMRLMVGEKGPESGDTTDYVVIGPEPEILGTVRRPRSTKSWLEQRAIPGSEVELNGVLTYSGSAQEFRIRLRTPADLAIVQANSWFTWARLVTIGTAVLLVVCACLAWIALLQRTIRKRTAEIREREQQLQQVQKMEVLNQLAGGIAHDFNNVLMAINGYAELLLDEKLEPSHKRTVGEILRAGKRGARLTRQLLTFSRKHPVTPAFLDLNEVLAETQPMLVRLVGPDIRVLVQTSEEAARVQTDRSQMEQVLINLAANARDAMPAGGTLAIKTAVVILPAKMNGLAAGKHVKLEVSDTGYGMDSKTMQRVFDPFFTTKEVGKGTGLGLSTVHGIVRQSAGEVFVESAVGRGTVFSVYLPFREGDNTESCEQGNTTVEGRWTGSVLLVEDEDQIRESVSDFLRKLGMDVMPVADGADALRIAGRQRFDLLVSDIIMPGMNGIELYDVLSSSNPKMKVVFVSGHAERALDYGATTLRGPLLKKPFDLSVLARTIQQVLKLDLAPAVDANTTGSEVKERENAGSA